MEDPTRGRPAPGATGATQDGIGPRPQTRVGVVPTAGGAAAAAAGAGPGTAAFAKTVVSRPMDPSASRVVAKNVAEARADAVAATILSGEAAPLSAVVPQELLAPGDLVGGRFRVERHISSGAFGAVYRASDVGIPNHVVAIKVLHAPAANEAAREQAMRELRLIASVSHPSVVQFSDYGWHQGRLWFAMPWYEGQTLDQRVAGIGLTRAEARPIFERIALGLAAMHHKGIGHHDIKPENIFLADVAGFEGGLPVLLDLGIAADQDEAPTGFTPEYVAPETAARALGDGEAHVGPKADVFSLALALRNCLEPETAPAMMGDSVVPFLHKRATEEITAPTGKEFRYLATDFARWLNADPNVRPTAAEFAGELRRLTYPEELRAARARLITRIAPIVLVAGVVVAVLVLQVSQQREVISAKEDVISEKETVISAKEEQLSEKESSLVEQIQQSKQQQEELAARAKELGLTMTQLDELTGKLTAGENLQSKLSRMVEQQKKEAAKLSEQNAELSALGQKLEENLNLSKAEREELEKRRGQLQKERDNLEARRDELKAERNQLAQNLDQTQAERDKLAARKDELVADGKALEAQRDALEESRMTLEAERDELREDRNDLRAQVEKLEGRADKLKKERDELKARLADRKSKKK